MSAYYLPKRVDETFLPLAKVCEGPNLWTNMDIMVQSCRLYTTAVAFNDTMDTRWVHDRLNDCRCYFYQDESTVHAIYTQIAHTA